MIHLVHGDDTFKADLYVSRLKSKLLEPGFESFNLVELKSPENAELYNATQSPAFGQGAKIVIVRDLKLLEAKAEDEDIKAFIAAIEDLPEDTHVIFKSKKANGTLKSVKALKKVSNLKIVESKAFTPWQTKEATEWLLSIASDLKVSIKRNDAEFLVEYLGAEESSKLYSELKRLNTLDDNITHELIEKECIPKHDIFKFSKDFASGNKSSAQSELKKLLKSGDFNIGTLAAISTNVSRYLKLKLLEKSRISQDEQAKLLSVSSGRLYHMKKEVAPMELEFLEQINHGIYQAEHKVKTGKMTLDRALKLLVAS